MYIDGSQNVGIGGAPSYKLDVSGQIRVNTAGSAAAPALLINDSDCGIYDGGVNILAFSTVVPQSCYGNRCFSKFRGCWKHKCFININWFVWYSRSFSLYR